MSPKRAFLAVAVTTLIALAALPATGFATDSQAPRGAGPRWLPGEDWVMFHWLPYDQRELFRQLHSSRTGVLTWLRDDQHHTLAQLARRRGLTPAHLAQRLVADWAGRLSPAR